MVVRHAIFCPYRDIQDRSTAGQIHGRSVQAAKSLAASSRIGAGYLPGHEQFSKNGSVRAQQSNEAAISQNHKMHY
jgi:hypothetical protein